MPWRDQALVVIGHSARDLARHFIQRWNQCKVYKIIYFCLQNYLIIEKINSKERKMSTT